MTKETKKEFEGILKEQREEYQRYLSVLSEDFHSNMQLVAESVSGLQEQMEAVKELVADSAKDIAIIKGDIQFIKQELKRKVDYDEFEALERRVLLLEKV